MIYNNPWGFVSVIGSCPVLSWICVFGLCQIVIGLHGVYIYICIYIYITCIHTTETALMDKIVYNSFSEAFKSKSEQRHNWKHCPKNCELNTVSIHKSVKWSKGTQLMVGKVRNFHTFHGTNGILTYMNGGFLLVNVGKYTVRPMDAMGMADLLFSYVQGCIC